MTLFELHPSLRHGLSPHLAVTEIAAGYLPARDCDWSHRPHPAGSVTMVVSAARGE
ncbi:hypothetical protein SKC41_08915 [Mycobacterium sp. 050128]|uniref:hypothetical protein n=1 Tax=Mycobacterium sp. 050128 TaxID=3096112 RepID=UPI002EDA9BBE